MNRGPDRTNRIVLSTIGLLLLVSGAGVLAWRWRSFGTARSNRPVLTSDAQAWWHDRSWLWWIVAVAGVLLAGLALRWLREQLRTARAANVDLRQRSAQGDTRVDAGGAVGALEQDLETLPAVVGASGRLVGDGPEASLQLTLDVREDVDLRDLTRDLDTISLRRFEHALERPLTNTEVLIRFAPPAHRHVR